MEKKKSSNESVYRLRGKNKKLDNFNGLGLASDKIWTNFASELVVTYLMNAAADWIEWRIILSNGM